MVTGSSRHPILRGGILAMLAALAFGVTTPLIQRYGRGVGPLPSASLLYAGAALASISIAGKREGREAHIRSRHVGRLVLVAFMGGLVAPVLLTWGLQRTTATNGSLLLNFEAIFTVVFAWLFFRERIGPRVAMAMTLMVAGGVWLVMSGVARVGGLGLGAIAVVLATMAWALDNTLTRPLADLDPTEVVRWKGTLGAGAAATLSVILHQPFPRLDATLALLACGATGYGVSLRLYLLAQRRIGAARTGSIFALAPFVGAGAAWLLGDRSGDATTLLAGALFGLGVYLHLSETHGHRHQHAPSEHEHLHRHDDGHHDHVHDPAVPGAHSHLHRHDARTHEHPHAPDLHHQHEHES